MDTKLQRIVLNLRRSVAQAFSESAKVKKLLNRIQEEGWTLYLVVDRRKEDEEPVAFELTSSLEERETEPSFRIDGRDLSLLKSLGIDPTRKLRRRRKA